MAKVQDKLILVLNLIGSAQVDLKFKEAGLDAPGLPPADLFIQYARQAEAAHFDAVFVADFVGANRGKLRYALPVPFEPVSLLSAVSACTRRIGLVATVSTLFTPPYTIARQLASLDHLSGGRAGWNIVTSFNAEANYGMETLPPPAERYAQAAECLHVVDRLWRSWDSDFLITDVSRRDYVAVDKLHDLHHHGAYYAVEGALDIPPPPQGRPVIFQAGASDSGIHFGARHAEVVFGASPDLAHGLQSKERLHRLSAQSGRTGALPKVLPGLRIFVAPTREEAFSVRDRSLDDTGLEAMKLRLQRDMPGIALDDIPLDAPVPADRFPAHMAVETMPGMRGVVSILRDMAGQNGMTLRKLLQRFSASGYFADAVGTPADVADQMQAWFEAGAADGFIIWPGYGLPQFFAEVVPELVRRGLFRETYTGHTLRDHLGLPDPGASGA